MTNHLSGRPRVFVDADVLLAACASPSEHGASLVVLRLAEITLIEAFTCQQVIVEARRNLAEKLPQAEPLFGTIVSRCLKIVPDPSDEQVARYAGCGHEEDLPILVAAAREGCRWLVSHNVRHFRPGCAGVEVLRPGAFILAVRDVLSRLGAERRE